MRIDGVSTNQYNTDSVKEGGGKAVQASSIADIIAFGSSLDGILKKDSHKSSLLDGTDGSSEAVKQQAQALRTGLKAIFNKMDTGKAMSLDEEGIDIYDTESDKIVTVVEQIQIKLAMYCDDFRAGMDIDAADIKQVLGMGAAMYKIAEVLQSKGVTPTRQNVSDAYNAFEMASDISKPDSRTKAYLLQNDMKFTISNIYVAENAGYICNEGVISNSEWKQLMPQVGRIIEEAGYEADDDMLGRCRWMLDNDIEVNKENLDKLTILDNMQDEMTPDKLIDHIAAAMIEGIKAKDAFITGENQPWENAVEAVKTVKNMTAGNIMALVHSDMSYTLDSLKSIETDGNEEKNVSGDRKYLKSYRELMEIRLMMTIEAAHTMEKNGISVNTTDISELVDKLREYETAGLNSGLKPGGQTVTVSETIQINAAMLEIENLKNAPAAVIGSVTQSEEVPSVRNMSYHAITVTAKLQAAGEAYEALSTEVRSDLGDSVSKAVKASASDLLSDMGYEDNEEGRRAVRILAYNEMDITPENVDKIKNIDHSVNELFRNMKPGKVLQMIRDGVNPLETDVTELNDYFINDLTDSRKIEKYSEFLCRLERQGGIDAAEREKFIGIYSLINTFEKDGMNALGALVNQGLELNMGNILTAYMTRRNNDMDYRISDDTERVEVKDKVTYYKNLFGSINGKIKPSALENMKDNIDAMSVEQFVKDAVNDVTEGEDPVYTEYMKMAEDAADMDERVLKFITDNDIPDTYNNIFAANTIITAGQTLYKEYSDRTKRDITEVEQEIFNAIVNKEDAAKEFDRLAQESMETVIKAVGQNNSHIDMETMRNWGNGMKLLGTLAHRNDYHIPYQNSGGVGIINLKIYENGDDSGIFTIKLHQTDSGEITIEGRMDKDNLVAQIMCSDEKDVENLEEQKNNIIDRLNLAGIENARIYVNKADVQPQGRSRVLDKVPTQQIFRAARIFIDAIAK